MKIPKKLAVSLGALAIALLGGCMAKDIEMTEQQQRMQRCDQYIGDQRDDCLRGMPVTIDDFNDDYRDYKNSKDREAEREKKLQAEAIKQKIKKEQEPEIEDKPI